MRADYVLGKEVAKSPHFLKSFLEDIPSNYKKSLRNMIKRLLNPDPAKRPKADELLKKNKVKRYRNISPYKLSKEKSVHQLQNFQLTSAAALTNSTNS